MMLNLNSKLIRHGGLVKSLPNDLWGEAVSTAVYILNISPSRAVQDRIPYEIWKGRRPNVNQELDAIPATPPETNETSEDSSSSDESPPRKMRSLEEIYETCGFALVTAEPIHFADLCGPMQTESLGGSKYFLLFTDDCNRMSWVYFLQSKSESFEYFKKFKVMVETQSGKKLKCLRTDRGGEFTSKDFTIFCENQGVNRELTAPYTPEQNGVAERKNRTVVEMARSMLRGRSLPNDLWGEAVSTAVYILNISPSRAVQDRIPYEIWKGRRPNVEHLRVFGCIAYSLVNLRSKLDEKSVKCIFIGFATQSKAYRLYNPVNGNVIISRNVIFAENEVWDWSQQADNQRVFTFESESKPQQEENQSVGDWSLFPNKWYQSHFGSVRVVWWFDR